MNRWLVILTFAIPLISQASQRIITIGGDVAEITYALGVGANIVARDRASVRPKELKALPDVGFMRQLNAEGILALKPTLVLTTERAAPSRALQQIAANGINVVYVPLDTDPQEVTNKIQLIATMVNQEEKGRQLIQRYQQQLASVVSTPLPVKALFIMNHAGIPPLAAGKNTPADTLFRAAGLKNAIQEFAGYRPLSQEGIIASAPDLLIITTHSVKSLGGVDNVWLIPGVALTPAGKQQRILVLDDISLLSFGLHTPGVLQQLHTAGK
ncbi:heme/hemin ABC transporter substrate-binding protein [Yersinia pekkanenii]|uniref:Hemin-binding periplasmic protein n=1 Tax=Yersinia pekkanenii TaxID=1288385 RepID=A0A0T9QU04_9GAMM|nr:ABC transporter substrate-binding protein [Yersinia pekkanenii]CNI28630.1 hemin-binding periplasmic protein [Yersinia pekkanenii]CRY67943.1 hemin-binding periplasmic protein [Yersinia pekkanenii]